MTHKEKIIIMDFINECMKIGNDYNALANYYFTMALDAGRKLNDKEKPKIELVVDNEQDKA